MNARKLEVYFKIAESVSKLSPDKETQVGCVLINPATGKNLTSYNGFIKKGPDSKLPATRPQKYQYIIHAEINAVCQAACSGEDISGYICICTLSPCINCLRVLWQCGIRTIYFRDEYKDFQNQLNMLDLELVISKVANTPYTKIGLEVR